MRLWVAFNTGPGAENCDRNTGSAVDFYCLGGLIALNSPQKIPTARNRGARARQPTVGEKERECQALIDVMLGSNGDEGRTGTRRSIPPACRAPRTAQPNRMVVR